MQKISFRFYHLFFGLIALGTLLFDSYRNIGELINYYSYFTTLSVAITVLVFLFVGFGFGLKKINIDFFRGAIVVYMLATGGVYLIFLEGTPDPTRVYWIDFVLHKLIPFAASFGWLIFPPQRYVKLNNIFVWLIFPIVYLIYTLVRGAMTGWYPYFFLNPIQQGYLGVFSFSLKITAVAIVISVLIIWVGNLKLKK